MAPFSDINDYRDDDVYKQGPTISRFQSFTFPSLYLRKNYPFTYSRKLCTWTVWRTRHLGFILKIVLGGVIFILVDVLRLSAALQGGLFSWKRFSLETGQFFTGSGGRFLD